MKQEDCPTRHGTTRPIGPIHWTRTDEGRVPTVKVICVECGTRGWMIGVREKSGTHNYEGTDRTFTSIDTEE